MSNQETRVFNKELAEVMAYAEADYRDAAKRVMQIPESEEHRDYFLSAAEQNANKAAKEYLGKLATILGLNVIETDTVPVSNPEIITSSPTIQATQADMLVFAAHEENVKKTTR